MIDPRTFTQAYLSKYGYGENPALAKYFESIGHFQPQNPELEQYQQMANSIPPANAPKYLQPPIARPDFMNQSQPIPQEFLAPELQQQNVRPPYELFGEPGLIENPADIDLSAEKERVAREIADSEQGGPAGEMGANGGGSSPIQKGVQSAMDARKQRLGLDEDQKREALGHALMGFFSNYAGSQQENNLARINESFNPAMAAWVAEKERARSANKDEFNAEQDIKKMEQHERLKQQELGMEQQRINIAMKEHERKMKQNAFAEMTPAQQQNFIEKVQTRYYKIIEREGIELDKYITNHVRNSDPDRDQKIADKKAEIEKRYAGSKKAVEREADKFGLSFADVGIPEESTQQTSTLTSFNKPEESPSAGKMVIDGIEVTEANFDSLPPDIQQKALKKAQGK